MAAMALVGALVSTGYKWGKSLDSETYDLLKIAGYYGFWIGTWFALGYFLVYQPRHFARALGADVRRAHLISAGWLWFLWAGYPVCWGISETGNVILPDSEFIFYGILDCLLIPGFSAILLWSHWGIGAHRLGLEMREHDGLFKSQRAFIQQSQNGVLNNGTNIADDKAPEPMNASGTV
jgi:bacteriorhodopsin